MVKKIREAQTLLVIPVAGMVALVLFEVMRAVSATEIDMGGLPPVDMLTIVLSLTALAPILLFFSNAAARMGALVISVLMTLFHGVHIVEHLVGADFSIAGLIAFTMFLPSLLGATTILKNRSVE